MIISTLILGALVLGISYGLTTLFFWTAGRLQKKNEGKHNATIEIKTIAE